MLSRNIASRRSRSLLARAVRAKSTQVQESSGPIAADGRHEVLNEGGFDSEIKWVKNHQNEHGTFLEEGNLYERPRRILRRDTKIISSAKKNGMQQRFPLSKRGMWVGLNERRDGEGHISSPHITVKQCYFRNCWKRALLSGKIYRFMGLSGECRCNFNSNCQSIFQCFLVLNHYPLPS